MGKRRSKGRSSAEGTPLHSDSSDGEPTSSKRGKTAKKGPKTSADICDDLGLEDVDLEFTEADYQNLTTFSLFSRLFRPQIVSANSSASSTKIIQVMEAKWREFGRAKVAGDKRRKEAAEEEQRRREEEERAREEEDEEDEQEEEKDDDDDDFGEEEEEEEQDEEPEEDEEEEEEVAPKKSSKSPRRSTGTLRIKMPMIALRKSQRDRKAKNYNEDGSDSTNSSVKGLKKRRKPPSPSLSEDSDFVTVKKSKRRVKPVKVSDVDSDSDGYNRRRSGRARKTKQYSDDEETDDSLVQKPKKRRSGGSGTSAVKKASRRSRGSKKRAAHSDDEGDDRADSSRNITATEDDESEDFVQVSEESSDDDILSSDEDRSRRKKKRRSDERPEIPGERKSERSRKNLSKVVSDREFERLMRQDEADKLKKKEDDKKKRDRNDRKKEREMEKARKAPWQKEQEEKERKKAEKKKKEEEEKQDEDKSGNESDHCWFCQICKDGGDLLLCDTCPKSFHKECLKMEDVPDGDWSCPVCTGEGLPEEGESEVEHEQFCRICRDGGDVLLCDFCPDVYHLKCVYPRIAQVPDGDWKCERCEMTEQTPKGRVKQILTWRWSHQLSGADELDHVHSPQKKVTSKEKNDRRQTRELFVRYEYHSYWDAEWIPELMLEIHQMYKHQSFKRKFDLDEPPALEDGSSYGKVRHKEDHSKDPYRLDATYFRYNIKPEWLQIHRVIAHDGKGRDTKYLVKWRDLSYEDCTWEYPGEVHEGLEEELRRHIDVYWDRRKERVNEKKKKDKPKKSTLKVKMNKDPPYLIKCGGKLHPYQLEGFNWLRFSYSQNTNTILADEMGLGKTIQTIAFLYGLWKEGYCPGPFLISAPLSTVPNWEREFEFWAPELYVVTYIGQRDGRMVIRERDFCYKDGAFPMIIKPSKMREGFKCKFDVLLTSYENINIDKVTLASIDWGVLVIDEAHRLKNNQSLFFQTMSDYKIQYKLLLTGTPLQNNLEELFNLLSFLEPQKFNSQDDFLKEFDSVSKDMQVERLHNMLAPHMLRRLKSDVLSDMPDKTELIVRVELAPLQKTFYKHILTRNFEALNMKGASHQTALMNIMMDLRKCCNHPYLFPTAANDAPITRNGSYEGTALTKACGKMVLLDKMLVKLKRDGHRVLIFSQMTRVMDLLEEFLEHLGHQYERIDGNVASNKRQEAIDRFNSAGSPQFVFLLSTKAGGLGINLATADTVIIYDMDWNPHNDIQAFSRAHRIGQKNKVMIYRFVARNTVEEKMTQVCKQKMMLTELIIHRGMGAEKKATLSKQDVSDILKYGAEDLFQDDDDKAISYNDAAVESLLDRKQAATVNKENAIGLNDYLKSFRVASYQVKENEEEEVEEVIEEEPQPGPSTSAPHSGAQDQEYWQKVLGDSYHEFTVQQIREQEEIAKTLGKGKRIRRRINYAEQQAALEIENARKKKEAVIEDAMYMSEYEPTSSDDSDNEDSGGDELNKELAGIGVKKQPKIVPKGKKSDEERKKELPPLMAKVDGHVQVLGFTARQRRAFLDVVMKFGLPPDDAFNSQWKTRDLRDKNEKVFRAYTSLFLRHLCEPITDADADTFSDGIPREGLSRQHVLTRVGMIGLIRKKVADFERYNGADSMEEFDCGPRPVAAFRRGILARPSGMPNPEAEELIRLLEEKKRQKQAEAERMSGGKKDDKTTAKKDDKTPAKKDDKTPAKKSSPEKTAEEKSKNGEESPENKSTEEKSPVKIEEISSEKSSEDGAEKGDDKSDEKKSGDDKESTIKEVDCVKCEANDDEKSDEKDDKKDDDEKDDDKKDDKTEDEKKEEEKSETPMEVGAGDVAAVTENSPQKEADKDSEVKTEVKDEAMDVSATEKDGKEKKSDDDVVMIDDESSTKEKEETKDGAPKKEEAEKKNKTPVVYQTYPELAAHLRRSLWIADGGFTELHALWQLEETTMDQRRPYQTWHRRHDYWLLAGIVTHGYRHWQDILNDARFEILNHVFRTDEARMKKAAFLNRRFQVLEQALVIEEQLRKAAKRNHGIPSVQEALERNDDLTALDKMASHLRRVNQSKEKGAVDKRSVKALNQVGSLVQDIKQCTMANISASLVKPGAKGGPGSTSGGPRPGTVAAALGKNKPSGTHQHPQKYVSQMLADRSKPKGRKEVEMITLD